MVSKWNAGSHCGKLRGLIDSAAVSQPNADTMFEKRGGSTEDPSPLDDELKGRVMESVAVR